MSRFFFNDTATTEIYTLSLHDALPIYRPPLRRGPSGSRPAPVAHRPPDRSEEHTSELQSLRHLVCRLLLEKKNIRCHAGTGAPDSASTSCSEQLPALSSSGWRGGHQQV